MLLRRDPFAVVEGALVAARAVGATRVVLALKESFTPELARVRAAVDAVVAAGWCPDDLTVEVFGGPASYLYGEETGLLEVLDGRPPFPAGLAAVPARRGGGPRSGRRSAGPQRRRCGARRAVACHERHPHARRQRRDARPRRRDRRPGARLVPRAGDRGLPRLARLHRVRGRTAPRRRRVPDGHAPPRGSRDVGRRRPRPGGGRHARRLRRVARTRRSRRPAHVRGLRRGSAAGSAPPASSSSTAMPTSSRSPRASPASSRSNPAGSARRASRTAARSPPDSPSSGPLPTDHDRIRGEVDAALLTVADEARCALAGQQQTAVGAALARFVDRAPRAAGRRDAVCLRDRRADP